MFSFYFQIKGKKTNYDEFGMGNWSFPPLFSGKVEAINKKAAKETIDELYSKQFPLRVLEKDLYQNHFLLSIEEIKPGSHIERLFELQTCKQCQKTFYVIDKYNDANCSDKSFDYCSSECKHEGYQVQKVLRLQDESVNDIISGSKSPIIYKITNRQNGMAYIGKTQQVFTLRWYQHFFQKGSCKFHEAIRASKVTDWQFEVQEYITIPEDVRTIEAIERLILDRERYWITFYNSVENGYNSL